MRSLIFIIVLQIAVGCKPRPEPLSVQPTSVELLGTWRLRSSPRLTAGRSQFPTTDNGKVILSPDGSTSLQEVLVEEDTFREGLPPVIQWRQETCIGNWKIDEWQRQSGPSLWRIRITLKGGHEMLLQICREAKGKLVLLYRPDPEMTEPFVFVRTIGAADE